MVRVAGKTPNPQPGPRPTPPISALSPTEKNAADRARQSAGMTATEKNAADRARREAATASSNAQKPRFPVKNPPLNPRAESNFRYGHDYFGLRRGCIIRTHRDAANKSSRIVDPKNRYTFQFLYNPAEISFSNQAFGGVVPPQYKNTNDNLQPMFIGQETVSFSLLLDRTQDAYEQGLSTRGTLDDVEALYRVCNGDLGSQAGFLSLSAVEIHWGPSTQNGRPLQPFPCYITAATIVHTQFTPRMCPIRTALTISATRLVGSDITAGHVSAISSLSGGGT